MYLFGRIQNVQVFIFNQICRHVFTSSIENNINKQSRMMKKILRKNELKKNKVEGVTIADIVKKGPSVHTQRRMTVLNKILMGHITDLMSTGEVDPRLQSKSIEISHVFITQDFKQVNIYWIDNSLDQSDTVSILSDCAHRLRYELCQLYIMGNLPPIKFVRYKYADAMKELEKKLAIADYGEDYEPSIYPQAINHTISYNTSTDINEQTTDNLDDTFTVIVPIMRHDVFGVDHEKIMSKIKASLSQSKEIFKKREVSTQLDLSAHTESTSQNCPNFLSIQEQETLFKEYLKNKQKEQRQKYKKNKFNRDIIYQLNEETNDDDEDTYSDYDDYNDNDFYDDDFTDNNKHEDKQ